MIVVTLLLTVFSTVLVGIQANSDCQLGNGSVTIKNVSRRLAIHLSNRSGELGCNLTFEYSWNIDATAGYRFDGFLYKLHSLTSADSVEYGVYYWSYGAESVKPDSCDTKSGKEIWALTLNNTSVRCNMPCSKYFPDLPSNCHKIDSVCIQRNAEDFHPLSANTRNISVPVYLGQRNDFSLMVYRHWKILSKYKDRLPTVFCRQELIENMGIEPAIATIYCNNSGTHSEWSYATGPPANFTQYAIFHEFPRNTYTVLFRWMDPYDIYPKYGSVTRYAVFVRGGEAEKNFVEEKDRNKDSFFYLSIKKVKVGKTSSITVTPHAGANAELNGYPFVKEFSVPEIKACEYRLHYCDNNADCTDLPDTNDTAAICTCRAGYTGNGMNVTLDDGNGCNDYDACLRSNICVEHSVCSDDPPPSMNAKCSCGSGYYGDGYSNGSGCKRVTSVVLLAIAVPLGLIAFATTFYCTKRIRHMKNGSRRLSKFFASSSGVKYIAPLPDVESPKRKSMTSDAFGQKYEISKELLQLKDILGRGNFGIVHKATLKTESGEIDVAVKSTTEPHSQEMEMEFLAEISLIISLGSHDNIMGIIGCCTTGSSPVYLITPFMKYGDLRHFLWDCREESNRTRDQIYILTEGNIYDIGQQVASGLEYVTGLRIIHGDIAARNVLVDEGLKCKISDFGLANDVYRYGVVKGAREKRVPIRWISPERMQEGKVPITWRSDVWSYGILLYEIVTLGATPFSNVSVQELFEKLQSGMRMSRPRSCSIFLYDIMKKCWEWTPSKRPSFKELKNIMGEAKINKGHVYANLIEGN